MKLRRASEDDWPDILEADAVCLPGDYRPDVSDGAWWVLEDAGKLAGYCAAKPSIQTPGAVYLSRAGVMPAWRGQRLQRRLVHARERWARANGYTQAVTDTYNNPASANTLIGCGYRMWTPAVPWSYASACYWVKHL